jgi:hypothetical protein
MLCLQGGVLFFLKEVCCKNETKPDQHRTAGRALHPCNVVPLAELVECSRELPMLQGCYNSPWRHVKPLCSLNHMQSCNVRETQATGCAVAAIVSSFCSSCWL